MSPYIITTSTTRDHYSMPNSASRHAVATLDEAREWVGQEIADLAANDGTSIEVEQVSYTRLREGAGWSQITSGQEVLAPEVIAAYNESQDA